MEKELYLKASRINGRISYLQKEIDNWEKSKYIENAYITLKEDFQKEYKVDVKNIDFGVLKAVVVSNLKKELFELEEDFNKL